MVVFFNPSSKMLALSVHSLVLDVSEEVALLVIQDELGGFLVVEETAFI